MNTIVTRQDQEPLLKLLRARQQTYNAARRWQLFQLTLTLLLPTLGAVLLVFSPTYRPTVALFSLVAGLFDTLWLDRWYRQLLKKAARIAEQFDCDLFELPWDHFTVKGKVDYEDIHAAASDFAKHTDDSRLKEWYPKEVSGAPMHLARLICQRVNLAYDSKLRTYYGRVVVSFGVLVFGMLLTIAFAQNLPMQEFVLTLVPAAPVLTWCAREFYRQRDTADRSTELKSEIEKLWATVLNGKASEKLCTEQSRQFQTGIFVWRANGPLGIPFLYDWMRRRLEEQMHVGAAELLNELNARRAAK